MAGQLITNTIDKKLATTTWLGEKILPANYNIDIPGNFKSFSLTFRIPSSNGTSVITVSYGFGYYDIESQHNVFHGKMDITTIPTSSPSAQVSRCLLHIFVPNGYDITNTTTSGSENLLNCHIKAQNLSEVGFREGELYTIYNLIQSNLITSVTLNTANNAGYNSGGVEFNGNFVGGTGNGKLIIGLRDYDYHGIKGTEYYNIFGVTQANSKCIKESDTSNIEVHYIYPVIGRLYSSYSGHNSSSPIATTTNNDWVIVPPYTLGYWYYNSTKTMEMKQYNPFNAAIFEYASDANIFGGKRINYGSATSGNINFNNVFLHDKSKVSKSDVTSTPDISSSRYVIGKSILYEGCYFRPDGGIKSYLDIRDIDKIYILGENVTKRKPFITPAIFNPGATNSAFTSSQTMNSINKIVAYKVKVGPMKGTDNDGMYNIYKHPTMYKMNVAGTDYSPSVGYNSSGYYLDILPIIHVPSSIGLTSDTSNYPITVSKSSGSGSSRKLVLTFKNIKVNVYDAAYASYTTDVKKLNASDIDDIDELCSDLGNAISKLKVQGYYTNTHAGDVSNKTLEYTYLGYNFTQSAEEPLELTGTPLQNKIEIPFSDFGKWAYYERFHCGLYMQEIPNRFIFGDPSTYIKSGEQRIGYDYDLTVDTLPSNPSNPSGQGVAMEIGEYDE